MTRKREMPPEPGELLRYAFMTGQEQSKLNAESNRPDLYTPDEMATLHSKTVANRYGLPENIRQALYFSYLAGYETQEAAQ